MTFLEIDFFQEDVIENTEISFMPKLKIKEKKLLDKIFKKISDGHFPCTITLGEFYNIYKIKDLEKIKIELLKFSKKKFYFNFTTPSKGKFYGEFNIISSFYINSSHIIISPPFELLAATNKNSIFHSLNLSSYARFKEKHSFSFFPFILAHKNISFFDFSVNELKKILSVENQYYERFYDFEKHVLKPLVLDINNSTLFNISYEKIKKNDGVTSKIEVLRFYITDRGEIEETHNVNDLLNIIKNKVTNLSYINHLIEKSLKTHSKESLEAKINWVTASFEEPLDTFIIASLNSKYKHANDSIKIIDISEPFSTHFKLEEKLYREINKFNLIPDYNFLKELQTLRKTNKFYYFKAPWEICIEFNPLSLSRIQIFLKSEI